MQIGSSTSRLGWKKLDAEGRTQVRQQNNDYVTCIWLSNVDWQGRLRETAEGKKTRKTIEP